jgi:hypothetical protein
MAKDKQSPNRRKESPETINVDFPGWVIKKLNEKAHFAGVSSQDLIKLWVGERLGKA